MLRNKYIDPIGKLKLLLIVFTCYLIKYIRIVSIRGEVVFLLIGIIVIWTGFDISVPEMNNSNSLPVIF